MSNHLISEVYKRQTGGMARNAVLVLFADKAADDGTGIWASKQRMADELGASKQTIITTIKTLISDGLVAEVGQRKCPNGFTIEYALNIGVLRSLPYVASHRDDQSTILTGQNALPVKEIYLTSQAALPDQSSGLTQTPLNPPEPPILSANADDPLSIEELAEDWNGLAEQVGLAKVEVLNKQRRAAFRARSRDFPGLEPWRKAFATIRGSPWLLGDNPSGWRADFDFLLQSKSFTKLVEGSYGQANSNQRRVGQRTG